MGKQIRIYLADGSPTGIRHAEVTNWTGQALTCPRSRFPELRDWDELKRPGVYFLFGTAEDSGEDAVYIGESEFVLDRVYSHLTGKEFWAEVIAFTSKDDNLTKGHVKYLESRLIQLATAAGRYRLTNAASPQLPSLPRADRDGMEEYLVSVRTLLGVLGHKVLEPYLIRTIPAPAPSLPFMLNPAITQDAVTLPLEILPPIASSDVFCLRMGGLSAQATRTDEGLVVLAGSHAAAIVRDSLTGGYRALRERLIHTGVLVPTNGKLQFARDQLFSSPSQAAAVIVGYSINGRDAWKLDDGTTYAAYELKISQALLSELDLTVFT